MKTFSYYALCDDNGDGRTSSISGYVFSEEDANQWKGEDPVQRSFELQSVEVCDSLDELRAVQSENMAWERVYEMDEMHRSLKAYEEHLAEIRSKNAKKQAALNKLSSEERELLGLK